MPPVRESEEISPFPAVPTLTRVIDPVPALRITVLKLLAPESSGVKVISPPVVLIVRFAPLPRIIPDPKNVSESLLVVKVVKGAPKILTGLPVMIDALRI